MLLIPIDRTSSEPLFRQICDRIIEMVESGALEAGDRLPPTRTMAKNLGAHRSTVIRAYDELRAKGYVESRAGSYTTVRRRSRWPGARVPDSPPSGRSAVDWFGRRLGTVRTLKRHPAPERLRSATLGEEIDFAELSADPALAPAEALRSFLRRTLVTNPGAVLDYADPAGWYPLRETLAARLRLHGVAAGPEEILITAGAQHAIDLILRLLVRPGESIAVEAPTYGMGHALFRFHGVRPVEVPMGSDGMDLDRLEEVLARDRPRMVYTMPNFQNPTGITMSQGRRERLLGMCERHSVPILEDGFEEEMKYFGQAVLPIKSMDARGIVLYVGTFSKVVFPGLRLGWIAAPRSVVEDLTEIHYVTSLSGNTLAQAAVARFVAAGAYERYLRRVHRSFRGRMQIMLQGLETHMPEGCSWTRPEGGYTVWLTLPEEGRSEEEIEEQCGEFGVRVSPGRLYYLTPRSEPHLRLSISCVDRTRIQEGCRRLGRALAQ